MRYALVKNGVRFCPVVVVDGKTVIGFPDAESAMLHVFEVLPMEAHEWAWEMMAMPAANGSDSRTESAS